jgi:hypothetical protein
MGGLDVLAYRRFVAIDDASGAIWRAQAAERGASEDLVREALGQLIAADPTPDPAEVSYYEAQADPDARRLEKAQRSYAGQYARRLKRLRQRPGRRRPASSMTTEVASRSGRS